MILLYIIFSSIFTLIFFLYNLNTEAVIYADAINIVIGLLVFVFKFIIFKRRHNMLEKIYLNLPLMTECLPKSKNIIQEDLNKIINRMSEINNDNITKFNSQYQDNMDYYTIWIHQIKTPISIMQMILKSDDTETNRELLAELFRIEQYSEMALNYLRLNSSSSDFIIRKYSLDNIIKQAVHRYAPQFIRRKIKLVYMPTDAEIITDEKWLLFIIEQILSNAVKYTFRGYVEIKYENEVLTISDTGIGIPEEDIPRIFEKGFTGLGGRKDKKATGLGLYLCKRSADKLGHKIFIKSKAGKGTQVSIDFNIKYFDIE